MTDIASKLKADNDIVDVLESKGVHLIGSGNERKSKCPFHEDGNPSFAVNVEKQLWKCHAGCGGGDVISLLAKFDGKEPADYLRGVAKAMDPMKTQGRPQPASKPAAPEKSVIEKIYPYHDSLGREVYQVVRLHPKTFRQRHTDGNGGWKWSMDGVTRVLYRLPKVIQSDEVWIVEGEKDADTLESLGFCATCNVGGAGKWLDSYTDSLNEKNVVICGDNDKPGEDHVNKVMESLAGKVKSLRRVRLPSTVKDVSDFVATFSLPTTALDALIKLKGESQLLVRGVDLPLKTSAELEASYIRFIEKTKEFPIDLGKWLPSLRKACRPLVPGDLVTILAGTGVGKTAILQNICGSFPDIPTVFFQMELSEEAMFERLVSFRSKIAGREIERAYSMGDIIGTETLVKMFKKLLICNKPGLSMQQIEAYVQKAELKTGEKPRLVLIDYVQLIAGSGDSRYERFSQIAEEARQMANRLSVSVVMTSQIKRKGEGDAEVSLTDAKESGAIENSSSLLLGAWRGENGTGVETFFLRVLKNSRGKTGLTVEGSFNDASMRITERSPICSEDKPRTND